MRLISRLWAAMRPRLWAATWYGISGIILLNAADLFTSAPQHQALLWLVRHQGWLTVLGTYACAGFLVGGDIVRRIPVLSFLHLSLLGAAVGTLQIVISSMNIMYVSSGHSILLLSADDFPQVLSWLKLTALASIIGCSISGCMLRLVANQFGTVRHLDLESSINEQMDKIAKRRGITLVAASMSSGSGGKDMESVSRIYSAMSLMPVPICFFLGYLLRSVNEADFTGLGYYFPMYLGLLSGSAIGLVILRMAGKGNQNEDSLRIVSLVSRLGSHVNAHAGAPS